MDEEELKQFLEILGYTVLGVKHFKAHDRVSVITPDKNLTLRFTLRCHVEDLSLEEVKRIFRVKDK